MMLPMAAPLLPEPEEEAPEELEELEEPEDDEVLAGLESPPEQP